MWGQEPIGKKRNESVRQSDLITFYLDYHFFRDPQAYTLNRSFGLIDKKVYDIRLSIHCNHMS